jgi:hypothetical protein
MTTAASRTATHARGENSDALFESTDETMTFPELFALPVTVDLATAARALGISMTTAYRLTGRDAFPCTIMRPTFRYRVPTVSLMTALGIDLQPVDTADVENGIEFARQFA